MAADSDASVVRRNIREWWSPTGSDVQLSIHLIRAGAPAPEVVAKYALANAGDWADRVDVYRGEMPVEDDATAWIYVGNSTPSRGIWPSDPEVLPVDVLEWIDERGDVLLTGVEGGWASWNGRPEFSDSLLDLRDAEAVDLEGWIDERRESDD